MKIDRLLGITIFLLNREKVSTRTLVDKFEVSKRTIQRDIETLNMSGIPIVSTYGVGGGYEILDSFKMERQVACNSDYSFILIALKGLSTAYDNPKIDAALEKILSVPDKNAMQSSIFLDFGVLREGANTNEQINILERSISEKIAVSFNYTNAEGDTSYRVVEPIALTYKWYSWYVFGFCTVKNDYRLFKLVRVNKLSSTGKPFLKEHENSNILLSRQELYDTRKYIDIKLFCKAEIKIQSMEYLKGIVGKEYDNGDFISHLHVPESEHLWFSTLLSLGNKAIVLEPQVLKQRLCEKAKEILESY